MNLRRWLEHFFPATCLLCLQKSHKGTIICSGCEVSLPWLGPACQRCALPLPTTQPTCAKCLPMTLPFSRLRALFHYTWPLNAFVTKLKYQGHLHFAKYLGQLMAERFMPQNDVSCILPMPLHPLRQRERGFNQTIELAKPIAKYLNLPLNKTDCARVQHTLAQSSLSAKARADNIKASDFTIAPTFNARHVLIIEDVVTTGATLSAFTRALKNSGVETIEVWACCRAS